MWVCMCKEFQEFILHFSDFIQKRDCFFVTAKLSESDYKQLMEQGQIRATATTYCHNITVVDDDLVEPEETLDVYLLNEYNIATVLLSPNTSRITIDDNDCKNFWSSSC